MLDIASYLLRLAVICDKQSPVLRLYSLSRTLTLAIVSSHQVQVAVLQEGLLISTKSFTLGDKS